MNTEESFPVFDLEIGCDFESSDQKFQFKRKQNISHTYSVEEGNIAVFTTIGKRNSNLDTFSYLKNAQYTFLAVFDGHGDNKVAQYLKEYALKRLETHELLAINPQAAIKTVLKEIEEQVVQIYQKGSTALIAIVTESKIIAGNVGDCQLFGLRKSDGKLMGLTRKHDISDQKQVAQIMSKGGLIFKRGQQYRINGQLNISRSIGDKKHKKYMSSQVDLYSFNKEDFKKIVLATDGFYRHNLFQTQLCKRSVKEIQHKVRKGQLGYGFDDNATAVCLKLKITSPICTSTDFFPAK